MGSIQSNEFIKFITDVITCGNITASNYCTRATILCKIPIFNKKACTRNVSTLNANCNVAHLAEYLFQDIPSCKTKYNCDNCGHCHERVLQTCNINVNVIFRNGLKDMQQAVNDIIFNNNGTCHTCKNNINRTVTYGSHLLIDTSILSDPTYMHEQNISINSKYRLEDVCKLLVVDDIQYVVAGLISYITYGRSCNDGHYVAFTYIGTHWYKYDDMAPKRTVASDNDIICPHLIIYIKQYI